LAAQPPDEAKRVMRRGSGVSLSSISTREASTGYDPHLFPHPKETTMPKLQIVHPHALEPAEVRRRLDALNRTLADKYGIEARWTSDSEAEFKRTGASGFIRTLADRVVVDIDLSFALSPVKSKVEGRIRDELKRALG
jgi:putative polyhydroxyalkanoate system protein